LLQLLRLGGGRPVVAFADIGLGLADPAAQGLFVNAQIPCDVADRTAGGADLPDARARSSSGYLRDAGMVRGAPCAGHHNPAWRTPPNSAQLSTHGHSSQSDPLPDPSASAPIRRSEPAPDHEQVTSDIRTRFSAARGYAGLGPRRGRTALAHRERRAQWRARPLRDATGRPRARASLLGCRDRRVRGRYRTGNASLSRIPHVRSREAPVDAPACFTAPAVVEHDPRPTSRARKDLRQVSPLLTRGGLSRRATACVPNTPRHREPNGTPSKSSSRRGAST